VREPYPTQATRIVDALVARLGCKAGAAQALDSILDRMPVVDLAGLAYDWPFWARAKQLLPDTHWRSFGYLTGRGNGKTTSLASHIVPEVQAGRAMSIGLAAQNEAKTIDVQVGGLIAASPPWFRPHYLANAMQLVWPNGAIAYVHTPEVPGAIRSHNLDLCWLSEVQSWPTSTREEALLNFQFATRVGYARTIWDATPKKGHPILKRFLARSTSEPDRHIVVRGTIHENRRNLSPKVIEDLERDYAGTSQGREELLGEMLDDSEGAVFKLEWIHPHRRHRPSEFSYRVISVDPAVTSRRGSDTTGIVEVARGVDDRGYVLGDDSGKYAVERWGEIVLDRYVAGCDLVIAETNKGGDLVTQILRAIAKLRGLSVVVVGKEERPRRLPGTVFVREVHARGAKEERARPVATAYERGRVSHVIGADLSGLEQTMTTWEPEPNADSPGDLDALVHGVIEVLGLSANTLDLREGFKGLAEISKALGATPPVNASTRNVAALIAGGGGGRI
jgi:phage terminase large subunit-like protein